MSKPVTASLNVIVREPTDVFRGFGVTIEMTAPGAVLSSVQFSLALLSSAFYAASMMSEPDAVRLSEYAPC
jgi:hypothetical protein